MANAIREAATVLNKLIWRAQEMGLSVKLEIFDTTNLGDADVVEIIDVKIRRVTHIH